MGKVQTPDSDLNAAQKEAVAIEGGPALIIAGAGTGKTKVIVERINKLLEDGIPANRLLALTFTEKAAAEMLDRVNEQRGSYNLELPIMTFNAYGESLLRRYAADVGLGRNFSLMGESAQIVFMRERLDELGLDYFAPVSRPDAVLGDVADYFSLLKQNVVTPEAHEAFVKQMTAGDEAEALNKKKYLELAYAYSYYLKACRQANVIDYDDQIFLLLELFEKRPNILKEVQGSYDYVMVDEFQDTNIMQSVLVDQVSGGHHNLFVVGDDDQSIYGWRGASLKNILAFQERYPKAKNVALTQNYRSTSQILDAAYQLIQHNNPHRLEERLHIDKRLRSDKSGSAPRIQSFENLESELHWIAQDIHRKIAAGTSPGDIAVLARRNTTVQQLHDFLDLEGIEHVLIGQKYDLYREPVVRTILEAVKAVVDPADNVSLYHTLTGPLFDVPYQTVSGLASQAKKAHENLQEVITAAPDESAAAAKTALELVAGWREKAATLTVGQLAYEMLESSGYKDRLYAEAQKDPVAAQAVNRLSELFYTLQQFEQVALQPSAVQYVEALPALQAAEGSGEDGTLDLSGTAVNLLTIHKSKGLEWPVVYIADCTEGSFPLPQSRRGINLPEGLLSDGTEADEHMAEERRLMYVAMTRARDELILTYAARHHSSRVRKPSRFLLEAFGAETVQPPAETAGQQSRLSLSRFNTLPVQAVSLPSSMLQGKALTLSVSQAQKYLDCPLDFYYCFVLNVPHASSPAMEYGSLMHGLLQDINQSLQAGRLIAYNELSSRLEQHWPKYGYLSAGHRDKARQQAVRTLEHVYERARNTGRVPLAVEQPFTISLPECQLTLKGRFDAVYPLGNGVEIVDFKTSTSVDTPEKAKNRASGSDQLTLYALAWQLMHDELPALTTLEFIDTGMVGNIKKTQRGIDSMRVKLAELADGIRAQSFEPGKDHLFCIHPPV